MTNKTNSVCRQILNTREVLESQIVATIVNNPSLSDVPLDKKKDLSTQIKSNLITQFSSLIDRVLKELS